MTTKRINSKVKGSSFELKIAKQIAEALEIPYGSFGVRRTPGSGAITTRSDISVHTKYRNKFPFFVELKFRNSFHLEGILNNKWEPVEWLRDAEKKLKVDPDYDPASPVILIFKRNNMDPLVMFSDNNSVLDLTETSIKALSRDFDFFLYDTYHKVFLVSFEDFLVECKSRIART